MNRVTGYSGTIDTETTGAQISLVSLHLYEGDTDKTELPLTEGAHTLKLVGKTANGQLVELNDPSLIEWDAQTLEGPALQASLSEDGVRFKVTVEAGTVGVITGQLLVNDAGSYPVSCMVGSTLSVSTGELRVRAGETAQFGVSSKSDATLTYTSADTTIATVQADNDGFVTVTGVKAGRTTVTVTASNGETATVEVTVEPDAAAFLIGNSGNYNGSDPIRDRGCHHYERIRHD